MTNSFSVWSGVKNCCISLLTEAVATVADNNSNNEANRWPTPTVSIHSRFQKREKEREREREREEIMRARERIYLVLLTLKKKGERKDFVIKFDSQTMKELPYYQN